MDLLEYEKDLYNNNIKFIAGVDEVGRGPLVGPVVACAVILPVNYKLDGLTDSKKLSEKKRELYFDIIMRDAISVNVAECSAKEIDELNIYQASREAMMRAINGLSVKPEHVLVDAMPLIDLDIPSTSIIKGDAKSLSIAAASVIAKVTRDRIMSDLAKVYPNYEFDKHKGYPTKKHLEIIEEYGVLDNYRTTYKPVKKILERNE